MMEGPGTNRRALMRCALMLVGAAALPGDAAALAAAAQSPSGAGSKLDAARFALLGAVADTLLPRTDTPGALDAGVPTLVDTVIADWASPPHRLQIIGALDRIDALARARRRLGFARLSPEQRTELLTPHDIEALKARPASAPPATQTIGKAATKIDPQVGRARQEPVQEPIFAASPAYADPGYGRLKELIVVLFYATETALTHDLAYEHNPGAWVPSLPVTPATRPWGGYALI